MSNKRFVLLSNPRTGSEYLARWLNLHPDIQCHGEVFAIPPGDGVWNESSFKAEGQPFQYLQSLEAGSDAALFGYKQISNWLANTGFDNVDSFIGQSAQHGYAFILLKRQDLLKEYVSFMLMMEQNYGHIRQQAKQARSITLNPAHAYAQMRQWDAFNQACEAAFARQGLPYLPLVYEVDFEEDKKVKSKTLQFLGVQPYDVEEPLQRTNPYGLEQLIANYDEVMEYLIAKKRFVGTG